MDKYLTIVLIFMVVGIPIAWVSPLTGEMREDPLYLLFYGSIGGIIVIMFYNSYKEKKERRQSNAKRRSKK
jgi:NADH:ubiquinone oxidoreductase subunit 3 (subunit A)